MTTCPSGSGCPACIPVGDSYLVVGTSMRPEDAPDYGAHVADHEEAVLVPMDVIDDAVAGPLLARIAEVTKQRDFAIDANQKLIASCRRADEQRDQALAERDQTRDTADMLYRAMNEIVGHYPQFRSALDKLPDWLTKNGDRENNV